MSSFLCFLCHSTVNSDTNEEIREKYREVVGMHLCIDSHLCHICCHVLNKLWMFRAVCLKRSLEYPVLFSEKGTLNLQRNELEIQTICSEDICGQFHSRNLNSKFYNFIHVYSDVSHQEQEYTGHQYVQLQEERNDFDEYFQHDNLLTKNDNTETDEQTYRNYSPTNEFPNLENDIDKGDESYEETHFESYDSEHDNNFKVVDNSLEKINNNIVTGNSETNNIFDVTNANSEKINEKLQDAQEIEYEQDIEVKQELYKKQDASEATEEITEAAQEIAEVTQEITEVEQETIRIKKKKSKKNKKKPFEKILLSVDEQKRELERKRKEKKYVEAEFKCYNCALGFLFKDTYLTHMMRHEESNGEYRCTICTLRFAKPGVFRAHMSCHGERYRCNCCGSLVAPQARKGHLQRCESDGPLAACHLCARLFQDSAGLQQHLKRFHQLGGSNRTHMCAVCGKTYANQAAVRTHMIQHVNRKFPCNRCSSTFSSPYTLAQHKKKHEVGETESHYCQICNVSYTSRKSLLAHKRNSLNHQETIFECPICSRVSPNERALTLHIESVHSGVKNYSCPNCPARYTNRKSLVRHMGTHHGKGQVKLAVCHLCGATFKGNNKLNRHLKEVCEKAKLEEEIANLYEQECMNPG